jgi:hypothetical protein
VSKVQFTKRLFATPLFCALSIGACTGTTDGPQGPYSLVPGAPGSSAVAGGIGGGAQAGGAAGGAAGGGPSAPGACGARLPPRLVLLSDYQHLNSLKALLGPTAISETDAAEHTAQTKPFTQKGVVVNASLVHQRLAWSQGASESFAARFAQLSGCDAARSDDACAQRYLGSFAARAFRRPVAAEEISDLMAVYTVGKATSFMNGVKRAVEAVLGAPSFMYRRELGAANDQGGLSLLPHELASELSFLLNDQPPDTELQSAADSGALAQAAELARQTERLLGKREVQDALSSTLISSWGISNLFGTIKDPALFPEYNPLLQGSMFRETELFVRDVLWDRAAPLRELLTSRKSFVNAPLAALYGVPFTGRTDEFVAVTLPEQRSGLLTQASVMSTLARTDTTSVVARGLFVRGAMLCLSKLPGPPESLSTQIQELLEADMTERERAEVRKQNATCSGCHAGIDPFGLLLEEYDPLGKYRTTLRGEKIDASAEVAGGSLSGKYQSAVAFLQAAAAAPEFSACLGTRLLAYATQDEELKATDCQVTQLIEATGPDDLTISRLVKALTASPALRLRNKETP